MWSGIEDSVELADCSTVQTTHAHLTHLDIVAIEFYLLSCILMQLLTSTLG